MRPARSTRTDPRVRERPPDEGGRHDKAMSEEPADKKRSNALLFWVHALLAAAILFVFVYMVAHR